MAYSINELIINQTIIENYAYDSEFKILNISGVQIPVDEKFIIHWNYTQETPQQVPAYPSDQCGSHESSSSSCLAVQTAERIDCFPQHGANENSCRARGCCWVPNHDGNYANAPWCFFPHNYAAYNASIVTTNFGIRAYLTRCKNNPVIIQNAVKQLIVDIQTQTSSRIRIRMYDPNQERYQVPIDLPNTDQTSSPRALSSTLYNISVTAMPFAISIKRKSTGKVIFDTSIGGLVYENQFLEISTRLASQDFYGLGEHEHRTLKHQDFNWKLWGLFARDQPPIENANLYGVHPFYLNIEDSQGHSNGALFLNSNAMEFILSRAPALTFRSIGGIIDIFVFVGESPSAVSQDYTKTIGLPLMPPYWSLGFQLSKYGYGSLTRVKEVMRRMQDYNIPLDVLYGDIDYMRYALDFTYDTNAYAGLPEYVEELHTHGQHYIIILDPAISNNQTNDTYPPYFEGIRMNVFVNDSSGKNLIGKVWPRGNAVFPDFSNPSASIWWQNQVVAFHKSLKFDGLWIDMNEPANFVQGSIAGCPNNAYNNPPYKPRGLWGAVLYDKTICMDAKQYQSLHYNVHSLYGHSEILPSLTAVRMALGNNLRSIVISRSTFPSSGRYGGHWLGDNKSEWPSMTYSIIGCLEFNMFGIPYIGADICGFSGDSSVELCNRWMQLGAFYTFSRNHNSIHSIDQDPAAFNGAIALNSLNVLQIRYTLLPYLYTLFHIAHTEGFTVMRPLMMEFPKDINCRSTDKQFMWGGGLLISPVLTQGAITVHAYFPNARWYDYRTGVEILSNQRGTTVVLSAPADYIPLHVRGGYILPTQEPANNTEYSRLNQFGLIVALDDNSSATGNLFWDDGISIDTYRNGNFSLLEFKANGVSIA
ncbi:uncharacterized protein TRIADDRAFT_34135 [Trichoplax adhaerens]|uniref:Maltase n=1 Tax=Trichoplax adhaerens TaxID=10228 RepID=B3SDR7_TRIAD|nr:hypothetical protein TRIADDRAFT_34135 [Trichoplax adhaerens]EDV19132.1 hypothetical protein TRIADDRAFT_34135 [Trichoplax adhaerens]|eukprot:XP_002118393.1 hypothetical protein TRIADDRAFT_34135 [Trichoplax adhaerens]